MRPYRLLNTEHEARRTALFIIDPHKARAGAPLSLVRTAEQLEALLAPAACRRRKRAVAAKAPAKRGAMTETPISDVVK